MQSKVVLHDGVEIYTESFGSATNPALLLIMGATAQGVMWPDRFCEALASLGFFVIRYDHRDTGKSSRIDYEKNPYHLVDLAADALSILDAYEIDAAHWVGASMGSFVAQMNAIYNQHRVLSLTCIMSSPNHLVFVDGFEGRDVSHHGLPASDSGILKYYQAILGVKAKTQEEAAKIYKEILRETMDVPDHLVETRIFEGRILKRLKSKYHIHNHSLALADSPSIMEYLGSITHPTLIIHGSEDYILPPAHGSKLATLIPNAKFIEYEHMGHCFTEKVLTRLVGDLKAQNSPNEA